MSLDGAPTDSRPPTPGHEPDGAGGSSAYRLAFRGSGGAYFFIFLKHVLLTILTSGVYFAWAKTERRAFIWKGFSLDGTPFRYTGTGLELFRGYVVIAVGWMLFLFLPPLIAVVSPELSVFVQAAMFLGLFAAAPYVIYRSRNYLYNRTTWRGIRFGLTGDSAPYAREFFVGLVLTIVTLGLYAPVNSNRLHTVLMNHTRFGDLAFRYDGRDRDVWILTMKGIVLTILTLGIYWFWYRAALERYRADHTRVGDRAVLVSDVTGVQLLSVYLINTIGLTLTLGLGFPWILMFTLENLASRFWVRGEVDFDGIAQRAQDEDALSDGLSDALDLDLGF